MKRLVRAPAQLGGDRRAIPKRRSPDDFNQFERAAVLRRVFRWNVSCWHHHADCSVGRMSAAGVVSRVSPVQTALRNCTRDEGGPFEFGNQVLISSHRKPLSSKAMVVNVAETLGHDLSRHGRERRAQANRCRSVESGLGDVKTGGSPALRDQLGGCPDSDRAASGVQAARSSTRLLCGT
jgi:hypothetical protein